MSPTDLRRLLAVAATAFVLRAGAAALTEFKPIFPQYYYVDAAFADRAGRETVESWALGAPPVNDYTVSQRAHIWFTAALYRAAGPRPIAPKLVNALAASLGVFAFGLLAARVFSARGGLIAAALMALWPSHVFYTSQNFKEGLVCGTLMGAFLMLTRRPERGLRNEKITAAAGFSLLAILGLLRPAVMLAAAAALAAAFAAPRLRRAAGDAGALVILLAAGLAAAVPAASRAIGRPLSPQNLTDFRLQRLESDRQYAVKTSDREIGTQLFPNARFESWLDLAVFLPKAAFSVLFMPLPGLYPLEGKAGRILAAAENLILLAIFLLALTATRGDFESARLGLLLFFASMVACSSFLEFDLGSAGRHKLMYLPVVFPFAAEAVLRFAQRRRMS